MAILNFQNIAFIFTPRLPYTDFTLYIKPPPIYVYTEPDVVGAADTANVIIKHRLEDGTLEDFPPEQTFELAVLDGCVNGNFLVGKDINVYFAQAQQPIKFVTADSLESDSGYVRLRVGTDVGGFMRPISNIKGEKEKQLTERQREFVGNTGYTRAELRAGFEKMMDEKRAERLALKNKTGADPPLEVPIIEACYIGSYINEIGYWEGNAKYEDDKTIEILLGETKYFQTKYNSQEAELKIEEIKPDANGVPQQKTGTEGDWEWITSDVWGNNPVSVVECDTCGKKMGIYWEKKYPVKNQWVDYIVNSGSDTVNYKIVKMVSLQTGLIRLIGRYWSPDSTYLVKLKAKTNNGNSTEIKINVLKPSQLKSEGQINSYSRAKDVFNKPVNIDSLCILLGGKYGILPQLIKGQMFKESAKKNFGGDIGIGFAPSYRYEPYTTQFKSSIKYNSNYNKFYIKDSSYSFSSVPDHEHVLSYDYFRSIKTVWDIIENYSQLVNISNPGTYGKRSDNFMSFSPYTKPSVGIQQKYNEFKKYYLKKYQSQLPLTVIADTTNERMIKYFKKEWKKIGAEKILAQTRAASSYGLLQMLYTTARDREYPNDTIPENINLINYLELFLKTQKEYLQNGLGISVENSNNWTNGFEYSISIKIYVPKWNSINTYAQGLYTNSQKFLPKK